MVCSLLNLAPPLPRKVAFMCGVKWRADAILLYWISNPLWVGGTLSVTAIAALATFFYGDPNAQIGGSVVTNTIFRIVVALIFVWGVFWSAILSLHVGKWLSVFGSYAKFALFAVFTVLA